MGVRPPSFTTISIHQYSRIIKEEDMFIWRMVLVALGVLVLILIIGIAVIAVKSIIAEVKKEG
ncbi:TPA: hypothetical protein U7G66_001037 [Streptococcus agalactiae]|nr:hypothetical protein [Streptococcus agalactiae]